jgi:hypothetical protein
MSKRSVDELLVLWASEKLSLFLVFQRAGKYGGSNVCIIEDLSDQTLRLSWSGETELHRRGELLIPLEGAAKTISDIDVSLLASVSDFINPNEPFVRIALPSGEIYWLVMMLGLGFDDFHIAEALRRSHELESGAIFGIAHEEVMEEVRRALQR